MTNTEKVFIFGSTGNIGTPLVLDLLSHQVATTIYVRNVEKAQSLFSHHEGASKYLTMIEGDNDDIEKIQKHLAHHTRLFLMINYPPDFISKLTTIATLAFEAGVQQIIHLSSVFATYPRRLMYFGDVQSSGEEALFNLVQSFNQQDGEKKKRSVVVLRPSRFTSNILNIDRPLIEKDHGTLIDTADLNQIQEWISIYDIAKVASNIFQDVVDKHGEGAVYELIGDLNTPKERVAIFEQLYQRPFTYQQISVVDKINKYLQNPIFPFKAAYDLGSFKEPYPSVTPGIEFLLGRKPQTFKDYLVTVKDALL
ncbi:unnamed protein product [Cunninghamella blakesleeana]